MSTEPELATRIDSISGRARKRLTIDTHPRDRGRMLKIVQEGETLANIVLDPDALAQLREVLA